jgi:DNA-binding MarR family transcriptional regulator
MGAELDFRAMAGQEVSRTSRQFKVGVWRALMEVHAAVLREIETELACRHGLTVSEFDALVNIPRDGTRVRELTERVVLSQSATSRLLDRLERRGFVAREGAVDDSRSVVIRLTAEGRKVIRAAARTNAHVVERAFADHLTPEELGILDAAFTRLGAEPSQPC